MIIDRLFQYPDRDKVILTTFGGDYTARDIGREINRCTAFFSSLDLRGKKTALLVPDIRSYLALVLTINRLGGTVVPLSWQFRKEDLTAVLRFLDPHIVFTVREHDGFGFGGMMREWAESSGKRTILFTSDNCMAWERTDVTGDARPAIADPIDFICCSSGSTGIPKGLNVSAESMDFNFQLLTDFNELRASDTLLLSAPPNSVYGISSLLTGIYNGARVVYPDRMDFPKIIRLMEETGCNKAATTPSIFKALYSFAKHISSDLLKRIELVGLVGEMIPEDYLKPFDLMPDCKFIGQYGSSEAGGVMSCDIRQGLVFEMYRDVLYKIRDGELLLKSRGVFSGYYENRELTEAAFDGEGWLYSGDLVRENERGKIEIIGRKKDMIKKGGQQVIPGEIESVLLQYGPIRQAVVVGMPHAVYGEQIAAFIVSDDGIDLKDLYHYCSGKIAGYKVPDHIEAVDKLPMVQGKVDKVTLRKRFLEDAGKEQIR